MRRTTGTEGRIALLFLLPLFAMFAVYFAYSFYFLVDTSFQKVSISFSDPAKVGWHNYKLLLEDPEFRRAILDNLVFAATTIIVALTVAFFIAVALAMRGRGRRLFYCIFLVPALTPVALVATIFGNMLQYQNGDLNTTLRSTGLGGLTQHWLTDSGWAVGSVIALFCYLIGLPIMYYTADLAAIRTDSLEAAVIDGAGPLRILRSVLWPMMRSTHVTVVLALLLGSFRAFEVVLFSTGGGPGFDTQIVGTYTYKFVTSGGSTIGYASAASVIVLIVAMAVSATQLLLTRTKDPGRRRRRTRVPRHAGSAQRSGPPPAVNGLAKSDRPLQNASRSSS